MTVCNECCSIEPRIVYITIDDEEVSICGECMCEDDTLTNYDEDYGQDR